MISASTLAHWLSDHTSDWHAEAVDIHVRDHRWTDLNTSVLDLKASYRGRSYAEEVMKLLPAKPEPGVLQRLLAVVTGPRRIHLFPSHSLDNWRRY